MKDKLNIDFSIIPKPRQVDSGHTELKYHEQTPPTTFLYKDIPRHYSYAPQMLFNRSIPPTIPESSTVIRQSLQHNPSFRREVNEEIDKNLKSKNEPPKTFSNIMDRPS